MPEVAGQASSLATGRKTARVADALLNLGQTLSDAGVLTPAAIRSALSASWDGSSAGRKPSDLTTQADAARRLGLSRQAIRNWVVQGRLRSFRDGSRTLVSFAEAHRLRHP